MIVVHEQPEGWVDTSEADKIQPSAVVGLSHVVTLESEDVELLRGPAGADGAPGAKGDKGDKGDVGPAGGAVVVLASINPVPPNVSITLNHALGVVPKCVWWELENVIGEQGFVVGDVVTLGAIWNGSNVVLPIETGWASSQKVGIVLPSAGYAILMRNKSTAAPFSPTTSNWILRAKAIA